MYTIGIRHEDKHYTERRSPLSPEHVKKLKEQGIEVEVESSPTRIFKDEEYARVGAKIVDHLTGCDIILGVKEIPGTYFERNKTYMFFSHVIKGQSYNMPMLKKMMDMECNLIDYEKVADDQDKRIIFFGRFAGLAGMINSLWSLGQRLKRKGYVNNPFLRIRQAYTYDSLSAAKEDVAEAGKEIAEKGLPSELTPLTIGFTGNGNVSQGAREIAQLLPFRDVSPEELKGLHEKGDVSQNLVYQVVFTEKDIYKPIEADHDFQLQEYYDHPERYESNFSPFIPCLTVMMNCMYWDDRYPRIFTKSWAKKHFAEDDTKIEVVGDVTCDPDGSVEFTHKATTIDEPVFVYDPLREKPVMGFDGDGILVMAVDILPSELPRDSSEAFGDALLPFIRSLASTDFKQDFKHLPLDKALKKALILHKGKLTPDFEYISGYLNSLKKN